MADPGLDLLREPANCGALRHLGGLAPRLNGHGVLIAYRHHSGQSGPPGCPERRLRSCRKAAHPFRLSVRRFELDDVVIATSENEENDALAAAASDAGVPLRKMTFSSD